MSMVMQGLEDPRVLFAAERTLLAWQRLSIALMGFGFVVEKFGLFLQLVAHTSTAPTQHRLSLWIGIALLMLGAAANLVAIRQYRSVVRALPGPPPSYWKFAATWMGWALTATAFTLVAYSVMSG